MYIKCDSVTVAFSTNTLVSLLQPFSHSFLQICNNTWTAKIQTLFTTISIEFSFFPFFFYKQSTTLSMVAPQKYNEKKEMKQKNHNPKFECMSSHDLRSFFVPNNLQMAGEKLCSVGLEKIALSSLQILL